MQLEGRTSAGLMYFDSGDDRPVVVSLHGVLTGGSLWGTVVEGLGDRYRCVVPELPFGAHTTPMPDGADLSLPAIATLLAEFLTELDLHEVTLVCNDWGGAQLVISPGGSDRVANLVLVSCEAFDNYPPGAPGRLLCATAALPGGTFLVAQLLRRRWIRHLPVVFGALSEQRVPEDLFGSRVGPLRHSPNPKIRRDLHWQRPCTSWSERRHLSARLFPLRWRMPSPSWRIPGTTQVSTSGIPSPLRDSRPATNRSQFRAPDHERSRRCQIRQGTRTA